MLSQILSTVIRTHEDLHKFMFENYRAAMGYSAKIASDFQRETMSLINQNSLRRSLSMWT